MDPYEWTDATLTFTDWRGTLALDQKLTGQEDIYDWTGIDRDEWLIVGLDFGAGETSAHEPHAIAIRRSELGDEKIYEMSEVRAADIQIHDVDPFELLLKMTHVLDVRLRSRAIKNATVTITELLDSPEQN